MKNRAAVSRVFLRVSGRCAPRPIDEDSEPQLQHHQAVHLLYNEEFATVHHFALSSDRLGSEDPPLDNSSVIVKRVDEKTRAKVGINELLRAD